MQPAMLCLLGVCALLLGPAPAAAAPPPADWPERYLDRELAVELYSLLQSYLLDGPPMGSARVPVPPMATKRNSEIINSLLALPKSMADVGRR